MENTSKLFACLVCLILSTAAVHAGAVSENRSSVVSYADLDLSHPEGMTALKARIEMAAGKVCGPEPDIHSLGKRRAYRTCTTQAFDNAIASISTRIAFAHKERVAQGR
jgi:UrcA family protein